MDPELWNTTANNYLGIPNTTSSTNGVGSYITPSTKSTQSQWDMSNAFNEMYGIGKTDINTAIAQGKVDAGPTVDKANKLKKEPGTDYGMDGIGGVALGAGQLGLGVMSYLDNAETADAQRKLLDQQYATNASELEHTQKARTAASDGLGGINLSTATKLQ